MLSENEHSVSTCFDTVLWRYHQPVLKGFFGSGTERESTIERTENWMEYLLNSYGLPWYPVASLKFWRILEKTGYLEHYSALSQG